VEWIGGRTAGWTSDKTAGWTETLKNNKQTRRATKRGKKTKQNLQRKKENTETRREKEKERQSLSLLPGKAAQGGREIPTKEAAEK
jgi:hypothetical protein